MTSKTRYYSIEMGGYDFKELKLPLKQVLEYKFKTKDDAIKDFFDSMVNYFKSYHESFCPRKLDEIEIENTRKIFYTINKKELVLYQGPQRCKQDIHAECFLSYGVSGGLNMGLHAIILRINIIKFKRKQDKLSLRFKQLSVND